MPAFYPPDPPFQGFPTIGPPPPGSNPGTHNLPLLTNVFHSPVENSPPREPPTGKKVSKQLVSTPGTAENATQAQLPGGRTHGLYIVSVKGLKYYRYIVTEGHKQVASIHIPGGNIRNAIARRRAGAILDMIRHGHSPASIHAQIRAWGSTGGRKKQNR